MWAGLGQPDQIFLGLPVTPNKYSSIARKKNRSGDEANNADRERTAVWHRSIPLVS